MAARGIELGMPFRVPMPFGEATMPHRATPDAETTRENQPQEHTSPIGFTMNEEMISRADLRSAPHLELYRTLSGVSMLRTTTTLAVPSVDVPAKAPVVD